MLYEVIRYRAQQLFYGQSLKPLVAHETTTECSLNGRVLGRLGIKFAA